MIDGTRSKKVAAREANPIVKYLRSIRHSQRINFSEIARKFGVSRERVRQLAQKVHVLSVARPMGESFCVECGKHSLLTSRKCIGYILYKLCAHCASRYDFLCAACGASASFFNPTANHFRVEERSGIFRNHYCPPCRKILAWRQKSS